MEQLVKTMSKRPVFTRGLAPNALRDWFERHPEMTMTRFAELLGVTVSYVSQISADNGPWPRRHVLRKIAELTDYEVMPNDMAGVPARPRRGKRIA